MKKLLNLFKYWLGITPKWNKATKASCWFGANADRRVMNILSPLMSDATFKARVKESAARGVNTFHLILVNQGDGEGAGYTALDPATAKVMDKRIRRLRKDGYAVVLWCMTDDSTAWAKSLDMAALMKTCKKHGWLKMASTICVGLELNEYWNAAQVAAHVATIRKYYKGKVATHQTSGRCDYAPLADLCFYQIAPGKAAAAIRGEAQKALRCGKPVNFFELDRHENRDLAQAALDAGCYGVGNW